jgi:hypothetical protein
VTSEPEKAPPQPLTKAEIEKRLNDLTMQLAEVHERQKDAEAMVLDPNASSTQGWLSTQALKQAEEAILESMGLLQHQLKQLDAGEKELLLAQQRERKEAVFAEIQKEGRSCPRCGGPAKILDSPKQPAGLGNFWTEPATPTNWHHWWIEFECPKEALRFRIYPDCLDENEQESKKKPRSSKSLSHGYMPTVLSKVSTRESEQ